MSAGISDGALESIIAMSREDLEREISFAEGFADPDPAALAWLAALREELAERAA